MPLAVSFYMANRMRKATIKQKRPMASDKANPRIAYEKSCCFRDGFLKKKTRHNSDSWKPCLKIYITYNKWLQIERLRAGSIFTWHIQWSDCRKQFQFQHQIQPLRRWQLQLQWTWRQCRCHGSLCWSGSLADTPGWGETEAAIQQESNEKKRNMSDDLVHSTE